MKNYVCCKDEIMDCFLKDTENETDYLETFLVELYLRKTGRHGTALDACKWLLSGPILTKEEHTYLAAWIKPFRNDIKWICKESYIDDYTRGYVIHISLDNHSNDIVLPEFDDDSMYNGMEPDRLYSLRELLL